MTEYVTLNGEILTVGTIAESIIAQRPGHYGWGVIEALLDETPTMHASALIRDINGRARAIPLMVLRLSREYPFCPVARKE